MPIYHYTCQEKGCKSNTEVSHAISECDNPTTATIEEITCPKHRKLMKRVPQEIFLNGATGKTERQLLKDKEKQVKARSRNHTIATLDEIKDEGDRDRLKKKYKGVKAKDPDKIMKTEF